MRWVRLIWNYLGDSNHRGRLGMVAAATISLIGVFSLPEIPADCNQFQEWPWEGSSRVSERVIGKGYEDLAGRRGLFSTEKEKLSRDGDSYDLALCARSVLSQVKDSTLKSDLAVLAVLLDVNDSLSLELTEKYVQMSVQSNAKNPYALLLRAHFESSSVMRNGEITNEYYPKVKNQLRGLDSGEYWARKSLDAEETPEGYDSLAYFRKNMAAMYFILCDFNNYTGTAKSYVELTYQAEKNNIEQVGPVGWQRSRELFLEQNPGVEMLLQEDPEVAKAWKKIEAARKERVAHRLLPECLSK